MDFARYLRATLNDLALGPKMEPEMGPEMMGERRAVASRIREPRRLGYSVRSPELRRVVNTTALRASFFDFARSTIIALPPKGKNAKALSEINGFDMDSIPKNLCCPLSGNIMDQPVYDPKHPQYKFERAWIEKSLAQKSVNPFTKTRLAITDLVNDASLGFALPCRVDRMFARVQMLQIPTH